MDEPETKPSLRAGVAHMWSTSPSRTTGLSFVAVIAGLLPTALTLAIGAVVGGIAPATRAGGFETPEGRSLIVALVLTGLVLAAQEALVAVQWPVWLSFVEQVFGSARSALMGAVLAPAGVSHLDDPAVASRLELGRADRWPHPGAFVQGFYLLVQRFTTALSSAVIVVAFRWWLGLGLIVLWVFVGRRLRRHFTKGVMGAWPALRHPEHLRQMILAPGTAKEQRVFGFSPWLIDRFATGWIEVMTGVWRARRASQLEAAALVSVVVIGNGFAFWVLADSASAGAIAAGSLVVIGRAILSTTELARSNYTDLMAAEGTATLPAMTELITDLTTDPRFRTDGIRDPENRPAWEVRFEGVSFAYPNQGHLVYEGLDLTIEAGTSLAVVGSNGAGKTTLVKLLARLYEPTAGRITVDGTPLTEFDPLAWQRRVAAIFQDFVHYELTAAENVGFGAIEHAGDLERLRRAAVDAGALDLIEGLSEGWDTILSRRYKGGTDLSGGEWQRVALARALMALDGGAGILVLDEPTANLDVRAEAALFDRFVEVTRGHTTVLISHRFSTVRACDRIVVLDGGRVVESGNHLDLVAAGGRYARMFALQESRYRDETYEEVEAATIGADPPAGQGPGRHSDEALGRRAGGQEPADV